MNFLERMHITLIGWILVFGILGGCGKPTPDAMLIEAKGYLSSGEVNAAVIQLKNVLQAEPQNAEAHFLLGTTYISQGKFPYALRELESALDAGYDIERVQLPLLRTKNRQGRFREVLGELEPKTDLSPELKIVLGEAYLAGKDAANARLAFEEALLQSPNNSRGALGLALAAVLDRDVATATQNFSDAISWNPRDPELWVQKGNFELASQQVEMAIDSFTHALEMDADNPAANLGIARGHLANGNLEKSKAAIYKVMAVTRELPVAYYVRAQIFFQKGEFIDAEKSLERSLKLAPGFPAAQYLMAATNFQLERYALSESLLRGLIAKSPDNIQVLLLMATTQLKTSGPQAALETLEPHAEQIYGSKGLALLASVYMKNGRFLDAIDKLKAALALNPADGEIRTQLALGYMAAGENEAAIAELEQSVAAGGSAINDDALLVLVKMREGDPVAALEEALRFQVRHPKSVVAYNILGAAHIAVSDLDAAKLAFEEAIKLDISYSPAIINLAKMAGSTGDFEGARSFIRNLLEANPSSIEGFVELAKLEFAVGNISIAIDNLNKAAALDLSVNGEPKVANISFQLGLAQLKLQDVDAAREHFVQALAISDGRHQSAITALVEIELQQGNRQSARRYLGELETLEPGSGTYHYLLGNYERDGGNVEAAMANFDIAVKQNHRAATVNYAKLLDSLGDVDKAITLLKEWTVSHSNDLPARAVLGGLYLKIKDGAMAIDVYEPLMRRSPNNSAVLNNLAWAYLLKGDDRAESTARKAYQLSPENPHMADTLGWILVKKGEYEASLKVFDRAVGLKHTNGSIYYHAAVAYSQVGRMQDARENLKKALAIGGFPEEAEAEALEAEIQG